MLCTVRVAHTMLKSTDILDVRDASTGDLSLLNAYWANLPAADLDRLSLDRDKLSTRLLTVDQLQMRARASPSQRNQDLLIWDVNGVAVGMSSIRNVSYGEYGEIHLHMIAPAYRRRGYGRRLFALSLREYFRRFQLKLIACEPSSRNPGPNKLLGSLGFVVARTYVTIPSDINVEHEVNRYEITPALMAKIALARRDGGGLD